MSRNFSFKTFFRSVSVGLLHQYFASQHLLADFDWTQDNALLADTLYTQIQRLPDSHAAFVEQDFALISSWLLSPLCWSCMTSLGRYITTPTL